MLVRALSFHNVNLCTIPSPFSEEINHIYVTLECSSTLQSLEHGLNRLSIGRRRHIGTSSSS